MLVSIILESPKLPNLSTISLMILRFLISMYSSPATRRSSQPIRSAWKRALTIFGERSFIFPIGVGMIVSLPKGGAGFNVFNTQKP